MSSTVESKEDDKHFLDKDWGAKIPEYIPKGCVSVAVFIMGITMRGLTLLIEV